MLQRSPHAHQMRKKEWNLSLNLGYEAPSNARCMLQLQKHIPHDMHNHSPKIVDLNFYIIHYENIGMPICLNCSNVVIENPHQGL